MPVFDWLKATQCVSYSRGRETSKRSSAQWDRLRTYGKSQRESMVSSCPDTYIRSYHGRKIWNAQARPGYGLYDRAPGCSLSERITGSNRKKQRISVRAYPFSSPKGFALGVPAFRGYTEAVFSVFRTGRIRCSQFLPAIGQGTGISSRPPRILAARLPASSS